LQFESEETVSGNISRRDVLKSAAIGVAAMGMPPKLLSLEANDQDRAILEFIQPPDDARPWVYWYFMDGHLTREGMAADLEAMKKAGLGGGIFLEAGIGIEPGPVEFMSEPWQELVGLAFSHADRLGLQLALAAGPGWCGTGGPWVSPDQSMQHLVASKTVVQGPAEFSARLPQPPPHTPFFGEDTLSPDLLKTFKEFYRDEYVLAFPTPAGGASIRDIDEKALYTRGSYSSQIPGPYTKRAWVRPFLPSEDRYESIPVDMCVPSQRVVNLTGKLLPDGTLNWSVPQGSWTILRFGRTLTGQTTRPSPKPGLGLESDKFDAGAMDAHFDAYIVSLLKKTGAPQHPGRGLVGLHFDSWEMSSQNWSPHFQQEFKNRRGYDPVTMLPTFAGLVVDTPEASERFLWDIRKTAQELVCEKQALRLRERGRQYGLVLSLEPYDLNPAADLELGATADIPMAEFWTRTEYYPPTDFSLPEATSVGHTQGRKVIGAEAFTAEMEERGRQHPASMKAQGDWAFCQGINKFVIHRFQAQPWLDRFPGMTMGPDGGFGVHWDRTQTWWDFAPAYHTYVTRCSNMLRRGLFVADILYLSPEGSPCVFFPPRSAFRAGEFPDRRDYNFDGCAPETLIMRASVKDGRIVFPDGMSYRLLVLPQFQTITPRTLEKVVKLVEEGATVLGAPPDKSPSLSNYPDCDGQVRELAARLWPNGEMLPERRVGLGRVIYDSEAAHDKAANPLAKAKWIGSAPVETGSAPTSGNLYFKREFSIAEPGDVRTAVVAVTADKNCKLFLNGRFVLTGDVVQRAHRVDVAALLRLGANVLTALVENSAQALSQTALSSSRVVDKSAQPKLIASLVVRLRDGSETAISTDRQWTCSAAESGPQLAVEELGPFGMEPWKLDDSAIEQADIYPSYASTAEILSRMGVKPDFETDAVLRYIHRRDGDDDFYFVANGESRIQSATCTFRVTGRQPEWWDAITGERRDLPEFTERGGRTEIPMRLEALESGFVVFRKSAVRTASARGVNFPKIETTVTLDAPWEVSFDSKWGGPERVVFSRLEDWSKRPEPGIRYYSGKATYRTTFDCERLGPQMSYFVALGKVANIASIKINQRDLGVAWCEPWRLQIPKGALQQRGNSLEVVVANLWTNRLIGDSNLPPEKRLTWITGNPFHPEDTLLESGLLGPVTIQASVS
jgi:hypothetical protein